MSPITFAGCNVTFAEDQPEYLPLPARREKDGRVITCWAMTWRERLSVLLRGRLYILMLTGGGPLQPILPAVVPPGEE